MNGAPNDTERMEREERIVMLLPYGRDAAVVSAALERAGLHHHACPDLPGLLREVRRGAGAVVLCDRALAGDAAETLAEVLGGQPAWSDLPLLVLASPVAAASLPSAFARFTLPVNVTVLERPLSRLSLVTALQAALRARRRQYEVRDLLQQRAQWNEALEARVAAGTRDVRRLAMRLTTAEAHERRRIARILHDHVQQLLYGIQMQAQLARLECDADNRTGLHACLDHIRAIAGDAVEATRSLTVELSPPLRNGDGMAEALRWLALRMETVHGLHVSVEGSRTTRLDEAVRELLFQSVRELLFNTVKHAGVKAARVEMREEDGTFVVEVSDEGAGFDPQVAAARRPADGGFGLSTMRERLQLFGGRVEIAAAPGEGTCVTLMVPRTDVFPANDGGPDGLTADALGRTA